MFLTNNFDDPTRPAKPLNTRIFCVCSILLLGYVFPGIGLPASGQEGFT